MQVSMEPTAQRLRTFASSCLTTLSQLAQEALPRMRPSRSMPSPPALDTTSCMPSQSQRCPRGGGYLLMVGPLGALPPAPPGSPHPRLPLSYS